MWCDFSRHLWCLRNSHHLTSTTWCDKKTWEYCWSYKAVCFLMVKFCCFVSFFFPEINLFFHCKTCVYTKKKTATFAKLKIEENTLSHLKPYPFFSPTSPAERSEQFYRKYWSTRFQCIIVIDDLSVTHINELSRLSKFKFSPFVINIIDWLITKTFNQAFQSQNKYIVVSSFCAVYIELQK